MRSDIREYIRSTESHHRQPVFLMPADPIDRQFRNSVETAYSHVPKDEPEKMLDNIEFLIDFARDKKHPLKEVLEQITKTIFRLFALGEVTIGIKSHKDGLFRYEVSSASERTSNRISGSWRIASTI